MEYSQILWVGYSARAQSELVTLLPPTIESVWASDPEEALACLDDRAFHILLVHVPGVPQAITTVLREARRQRSMKIILDSPGGMHAEPDWLVDDHQQQVHLAPAEDCYGLGALVRKLCEEAGYPAPVEPWREVMVGEHRSMQVVAEVIRLVARRRATVLITGETGTGKEIVARALHMASLRTAGPLVALNCSALPESLLEAELFGHTKGAFTGASAQRIGLFEQANRGSIFLDEVGELPLGLQAKLLRVLQEREIQRLGSSETVRLDLRVIAATNTDLEAAVRQGRFRQDLYYRLNVVPIHMPPLRDRLMDIPLLVDRFILKICRAEGLPLKRIDPAAIQHLSSYSWPGNVRELEHQVEKAIALSGDRRVLRLEDFTLPPPHRLLDEDACEGLSVPESGIDFDRLIARIERSLLDQALRKSGGNKARAADMLGMKRTTLLSKAKALGCYA